MKATLVLLLCLVTLSCSLKVYKQNADTSLACCGSNSYDQNNQFCCIDSVFKIDNSNSGQCCGNRVLNDNQQCCFVNEDQTPSKSDKSFSDTQICCSGSVFSNGDNSFVGCCGDKALRDGDLCCENDHVNRGNCCWNVDKNWFVVANGETNGKQCCGSSTFNSDTQQCCNGRAISSDQDCCASAGGFDQSTRTCCTFTEEETLPKCCDGTPYTVTTVTGKLNGQDLSCCNENFEQDSFADNLNAANDNQFCCGNSVFTQNSDNSLACCGTRTFNTNTQTCCAQERSALKPVDCGCGCQQYTVVVSVNYNVGSVANGECCDGTAYDSSSKLCCPEDLPGAKLFSQSSNQNRACCGVNSFDSSNDICCNLDPLGFNSQVFTNKANTDVNYECCLSFSGDSCSPDYHYSIFDTDKQACPCGKVIDINKDLTQNNNDPNVVPGCCGTEQYDAAAKLCCAQSGSIFDEDPAIGRTCCATDGKTRYNPGYQVCCKGSSCTKPCNNQFVIPGTRDVEDVEGSSKDNKDKKNKKDKNGSGLVNCGNACCDVGSGKFEGYFSQYQKCCGGVVLDFASTLDLSSPLACCGKELYNADRGEACCFETKVSGSGCNLKVSGSTAIYNTNTEICCTNVNEPERCD